MTTNDILMLIFTVTMLLFVITMVRHWLVMRWLTISLNAFVEQQKQFAQLMELERERNMERKRTN